MAAKFSAWKLVDMILLLPQGYYFSQVLLNFAILSEKELARTSFSYANDFYRIFVIWSYMGVNS